MAALGAATLAVLASPPIASRADVAPLQVPGYGSKSSSETLDVGSGTVGEVACSIKQALTESPNQRLVLPGPVNTLTAAMSTSCWLPSGDVTLTVTLEEPTQLTPVCTKSVDNTSDAPDVTASCSVDHPAVGNWTATYQALIEVYEPLGPNDQMPSGCGEVVDTFTAWVSCNYTLTTDIAPDTTPLFSAWYPPPL